MVHLLFDYPIKPLDWSLERLVEGRCSIVCQPERVFRLLQDEFFDYFNGMFPVRMWNMYALEGPRTNNHAEGWHSKVQKLAGKAHPNIYEAVTLFQSEQATTEVSIMQLAAGGLWEETNDYLGEVWSRRLQPDTRHKNNRSVPKITEPYRAWNRAGVRLHYIKNNRAESIIEGVIEHVRISISALQLARASSMATSHLRIRCMRSFTEHRQSE